MPNPKQTTVVLGGPNGLTALDEAIRQLSPGGRLEVHPGTWKGRLVLPPGASIIGLGQSGEVVIDGTESANTLEETIAREAFVAAKSSVSQLDAPWYNSDYSRKIWRNRIIAVGFGLGLLINLIWSVFVMVTTGFMSGLFMFFTWGLGVMVLLTLLPAIIHTVVFGRLKRVFQRRRAALKAGLAQQTELVRSYLGDDTSVLAIPEGGTESQPSCIENLVFINQRPTNAPIVALGTAESGDDFFVMHNCSIRVTDSAEWLSFNRNNGFLSEDSSVGLRLLGRGRDLNIRVTHFEGLDIGLHLIGADMRCNGCSFDTCGQGVRAGYRDPGELKHRDNPYRASEDDKQWVTLTGLENVKLQNCTFTTGTHGLVVLAGWGTLDDSKLSALTGNAVFAAGQQLNMQRCVITDGKDGVFLFDGEGFVQGCTIENMSGHGVHRATMGECTISGNTFRRCLGFAVSKVSGRNFVDKHKLTITDNIREDIGGETTALPTLP